jgi:hypothetical protein
MGLNEIGCEPDSPGQRPVAGSFEHGYEPLSSIKHEEFVDRVRTRFLRKALHSEIT